VLNAIGDSLSGLGSSDEEEDGEHEEDEQDTEHGKLREDDEPGWVMGSFIKMVQHHKESFRQKQMRPDELTQLGWGDVAEYFQEGDMWYGIAELMVQATVKAQTDTSPDIPFQTTFEELMQTIDIVPGQSQMPQETSRPGSSQMRLVSEKPQSHTVIASLLANVVANSSLIENAMAVEPISFDPRLSRP